MTLTRQSIITLLLRCRRLITPRQRVDEGHDNPSQAYQLTAIERHRSRQGLQHLDSRLLRDIGLTEAEARREQRKPIWK